MSHDFGLCFTNTLAHLLTTRVGIWSAPLKWIWWKIALSKGLVDLIKYYHYDTGWFFLTWNFQISRKISTVRKNVQNQNLIMPRGKYTSAKISHTSAKISPPPPLLVGGAGVNFEALNGNCYFLITDSESTDLKVRMICLKLFFRIVIDGAESTKFKFFEFILLRTYAVHFSKCLGTFHHSSCLQKCGDSFLIIHNENVIFFTAKLYA